jgi:hypothetical protein
MLASYARAKRSNSNLAKSLMKENLRFARRRSGWILGAEEITWLRTLTEEFSLSISKGDLLLLNQKWYITHTGLLHIAHRTACAGIHVQQVHKACDPIAGRWVFRATVYRSPRSRGFVGYGDADPSNVSSLVQGAEMRVAETRAVNRALRKAYGIGLCSVEELGWSPHPSGPDRSHQGAPPANGNNGHQNGQPRLRDQLCLLIRKHQLEASLVKAYAADYCGTPALRDATKSQIESFVAHLADWAVQDRDALLCKLNSYSPTPEVHT